MEEKIALNALRIYNFSKEELLFPRFNSIEHFFSFTNKPAIESNKNLEI